MAWIDIVIIVIVVSLIIHGIATGLIRGAFDIAGIVIGYVVAVTYSATVRIPQILAFILVFVVVILIFAIAGRIISRIVHLTPLGWIDRLLGGALGLIKGFVICFVFLVAVMYMKKDVRILSESQFASQIADAGMKASKLLPKPLYEWIEDVFGRDEIVVNENNHFSI